MKKIIIILAILSLFMLTGCGDEPTASEKCVELGFDGLKDFSTCKAKTNITYNKNSGQYDWDYCYMPIERNVKMERWCYFGDDIVVVRNWEKQT